MILGLGCDIVKVSRFDRGYKFLAHFARKYLTLKEINELHHKITSSKESELVLALATRFAAKEAVSKALGSGFRNGITLQSIEITHNQLGKPEVTLYQNALARAYLVANNTAFKIHLTISNEHEYVNAVAVLETI